MNAMFSDILLCVDYDRTLTGPDGSVPARNIEAIEYFIANGGAFTVNTGRSLPMARPFLDKLPLSAPLLLYNGSAAYDAKAGAFTRTYPIELDPAAFVRALRAQFPGIYFEVQAMDGHYAFHRDPDWEAFSENGGCPWGYIDVDHIPEPFLKVTAYCDCTGQTMQSMYQGTEAQVQTMRDLINQIHARFGAKVEAFHSTPKIVDIHARGVSKLRAARDLQQALGKKHLVCVGDGHNDLDMLRGADWAFCPSDGALADWFENVCPCGEGAVADVIYEKLEMLKNKA